MSRDPGERLGWAGPQGERGPVRSAGSAGTTRPPLRGHCGASRAARRGASSGGVLGEARDPGAKEGRGARCFVGKQLELSRRH